MPSTPPPLPPLHSTAPAFHLLPLTPADISRCVDIYFAAFQNPHSLACWPRGKPTVRAWWEHMFAAELAEPGAHWLKAVTDDSDTDYDSEKAGTKNGTIAGFAKWVAPNPGRVPDTTLPAWPAGADAALCEETFGAWARAHAEILGARGHWYLEMLATDPAFQGRGAGSQLLRWGLARADAAGVEAYLEASPAAVPLYEKLGFREAGRTETWIAARDRNSTATEGKGEGEGEWYRNLYMLRPAARAAAAAAMKAEEVRSVEGLKQ